DRVEERHEVRRRGERLAELLPDVALVGLDVARLVLDLRRGVELLVGARSAAHDLRGREERSPLAVEELAQDPGRVPASGGAPLLLRQALPYVRAVDGAHLL